MWFGVCGMIAGFRARLVERLRQLFPERQIYHRHDGRVQFVVLSPRFQMISVAVGLTCLSWVAYASVMTAFKDEIVAAKDERIKALQVRYEQQIATMRLDYDDLSGKLALAEQRFESTVAAVEKRQSDLKSAMTDQASASDALNEVMRRAATVRALGLATDGPTIPMEEDAAAAGGVDEHDHADKAPAKPEQDAKGDAKAEDKRADAGDAEFLPLAKPDAIAVANAGIEAAPIEESADAGTVASSDFVSSGRNVRMGASFAALEDRLETLLDDQGHAAAGLAEEALAKEQSLRDVLSIAGLNADTIVPRDDAVGGPFIPALPDSNQIDPQARDANLDVADTTMERVALLQTAMLAVPFANPVPGVTRISSGFGHRSDPFHGGRAYHSGLDFKGPMATDILATAPGVVTVAEWQGGYGQMVEIDHGYGLKTRYAHLSAIDVEKGQTVAFGHKVGALGSTGRSTGPHLHYEVWYNGQAQNPWNYLEAGANVLKRQGT